MKRRRRMDCPIFILWAVPKWYPSTIGSDSTIEQYRTCPGVEVSYQLTSEYTARDSRGPRNAKDFKSIPRRPNASVCTTVAVRCYRTCPWRITESGQIHDAQRYCAPLPRTSRLCWRGRTFRCGTLRKGVARRAPSRRRAALKRQEEKRLRQVCPVCQLRTHWTRQHCKREVS